MSDKPPVPELRFYRSPVDYEAWRNGYTPPTEHVLIHHLSVGDVKVVASSACGGDGWWLVVKGGKTLSRGQRKAMLHLFEIMEEIEAEEVAKPAEPSELGPVQGPPTPSEG